MIYITGTQQSQLVSIACILAGSAEHFRQQVGMVICMQKKNQVCTVVKIMNLKIGSGFKQKAYNQWGM